MNDLDITKTKQVLALPKGRILDELLPVLVQCDIHPEADFFDSGSRKLRFSTNHTGLDIVRVRAFDVATFVAFGGADFGVVGSDVLEEFQYEEIYAPVDLGIGTCRLSLAMPVLEARQDNPHHWSHIRVATKYPNLTRRYFAERGVQAECISLSGAMEIVPALGLARRIVDLVSSGATLSANGLVEVETLLAVSARLVVNRTALKTCPDQTQFWIGRFRDSVCGGAV